MDESTQRVARDEPDQPQHQQNYENRPKHVVSSSLTESLSCAESNGHALQNFLNLGVFGRLRTFRLNQVIARRLRKCMEALRRNVGTRAIIFLSRSCHIFN